MKTDRITFGRTFENCYFSPVSHREACFPGWKGTPGVLRNDEWLCWSGQVPDSGSSQYSLCPPFSKQNPKNLDFAPHRCPPVLLLQVEFLLENRFIMGQGQHGVVTRFLTGTSSVSCADLDSGSWQQWSLASLGSHNGSGQSGCTD